MLVDPDSVEEADVTSDLTLGYLPSLEQVVCCLCEGLMSSDVMAKGQRCSDFCFMRAFFKKNIVHKNAISTLG